MDIEDEIKQKKFKSPYQKASINLLYTSNWVYSAISSLLKPHHISPEQFNVLRILRGRYPDPASVTILNERMLDKMSNVSRIVEKLRHKELLTRTECPADRRQVDINITQKGLDLLNELDETNIETGAGAMANLSESEAEMLSTLLNKVRG